MRQKIKEGKPTIFNLTLEEKEIIKNMANIQGCSQSDFIGWLVRNYAITKDPIKEMELLTQEEKKHQNAIDEIKSKQAEVLERMKAHKENEKNINKNKEHAIRLITRKIREGSSRLDIESVARFWSMRLNTDYVQLLFEATQKVKNEKMSSM